MAVYFMGIQRYLWMQFFIQYNILYAEFRSMTMNSKGSKDLIYIHDNNIGRGAIYFTRLFFHSWEFFYFKKLIKEEWTHFITIPKWKISTYIKQALILIIKFAFMTSTYLLMYGTFKMGEVTEKSHREVMILNLSTLIIQKNIVLLYKRFEWKGRKILIMIML